MKNRVSFVLVVLSPVLFVATLMAQTTPELIDIGKGYTGKDVNDAGNIAANYVGGPGVWTKASNSWTTLQPAPGFLYAGVNAINNSGQVVGQSSQFGNESAHTATKWSSNGGPGTDIGIAPCIGKDAFSDAYAINDGGVVAGTASAFLNGGCTGPFPAGGGSFTHLIGNMEPGKGGSSASEVGNNGVFVGHYDGNYGIVAAGGVVDIGFVPRKVLNDGTIIGSAKGASGVVRRSPSGVNERIPCGTDALDANEAGDILVSQSGGLRMFHEGVCHRLSDIVPTDKIGYNFPFGAGRINAHGQIMANATRPGETSANGPTLVLLTPQYPLDIKVIGAPTGVPGEYEFQTQVLRGNPQGNTRWDFGDGTTANTSVGTKAKKKYTKPGTFNVKATVQDATGATAVNIIPVVIAAPTLLIGISLPDFPNLEVPLGETVVVKVSVGASTDGVGDLSDLAFQGGTFTVSDGSILEFTTASTSPFSLSPGSGNEYPLSVKAALVGSVDLKTLIIGKDAAGRNVSATDGKTVVVKPGDQIIQDDPSASLISKIDQAALLMKSFKQTPTRKQKVVQNQIKTQLKGLANELQSFLKAHSSEIKATSSKVNLAKLAKSAKAAVVKVTTRGSTFAADKKAANKALTALKKGILVSPK